MNTGIWVVVVLCILAFMAAVIYLAVVRPGVSAVTSLSPSPASSSSSSATGLTGLGRPLPAVTDAKALELLVQRAERERQLHTQLLSKPLLDATTNQIHPATAPLPPAIAPPPTLPPPTAALLTPATAAPPLSALVLPGAPTVAVVPAVRPVPSLLVVTPRGETPRGGDYAG